MLRDLSIEHINAAVNAVGIIAKHHRCDGPMEVHNVSMPCYRPDIVEFFDKSGDKVGTLVEPKKIFTWGMTDYRIETVWDIKNIVEKNPHNT